MLNKKTVTIQKMKFEMRELNVAQLQELLPMFEDQPNEAQLRMLGLCVFTGGESITDLLPTMGISMYKKLTSMVMDINGLSGEEDEGKG